MTPTTCAQCGRTLRIDDAMVVDDYPLCDDNCAALLAVNTVITYADETGEAKALRAVIAGLGAAVVNEVTAYDR